jgi:hypothetical protein
VFRSLGCCWIVAEKLAAAFTSRVTLGFVCTALGTVLLTILLR